jgi:pimeloyl-ACP methyl ester carboxylesterase
MAPRRAQSGGMKTFIFLLLGCALMLPCSARPDAAPKDSELLVEWNRQLLVAAEAEDRFLTLKGVRAAAMMHLAIHDAINCIDARYRTYLLDTDGRGADPIAAAIQAAFAVVADQYPGDLERWESLRRRGLQHRGDATARDAGIALGDLAAQRVLAHRSNDRWNQQVAYQFRPMAPGVYAEFSEHSGTPQGFVFGAGWATVEPFALRSPSQFRSPPPPRIRSEAYRRAFDEVRTLGRLGSPTRTAQQTHIAYWWKEFVESSHNRLARRLVSDEQPDLWTAARFFALLNVSIVDAYIGAFDSKFFHNHWRPYTAIRRAAHDGNPHTLADETWTNTHQHTYAFPSYPSAHGTACAAAMAVFADTFGDRRWFYMSTPQVDAAGPLSEKIPMRPATRAFDSFSQAARECAWSRVYLGIHFRYDAIEGTRLGSRIGQLAVRKLLRPLGAVPEARPQPWQRAVIGDVTLEYRLRGLGDDVVFVHGGLIADGLAPLAAAPPIAARHRVLTWHRVGYAGSSLAAGHADITAQAAQLAGLMRHLGIGRAHIVGHSSGGSIALQLALQNPALVRSLVLLEAVVPVPGAANPGIANAIQLHAGGDDAAAIDAFMRAVAGADWRLQVERKLPLAMDQALADAAAFFEQELPAVRAWPFGVAEAQRIRVPVLAVLGGASGEVSPIWNQRNEFLLANLGQVEPYILPGAKHWLALEDPHGLARQLAAFFKRR